jgi:murein endopeptidase
VDREAALDPRDDVRASPRILLVLTVLSLVTSIASLTVSAMVYGRLEAREDSPERIVLEAPVEQAADESAADEADPRGDPGQSIGSPRGGALYNATRLPPGDGYHIRHPSRVFGTKGTVRHLVAAIDEARRQFPRLHRLSVGDLSGEVGGLLSGHVSHQSGRDVDLGFFYRHKPRGYPQKFANASRDNLHFRATWALVEALAATRKQPEGVAWILLDYRVQKLLYSYAVNNGVPRETIEDILQYPRGPTAETGLVRHFPGHENHLHVRFRCAVEDPHCRSGNGPWNRLKVEFPGDDVASAAPATPEAQPGLGG